jgi:hypothetical protein
MSRITGSDAKGMMEACAAVYASQEIKEIELTEEQIWEEVENWVNSLLEEGHDLSEYTWEEMYESYIGEAIGQPGSAGMVNWKDPKTGQVRSGYKSSSDGKLYANYNDALAARNSRVQGLAVQQGLNRTFRAGGGQAALAQGRLPSEIMSQGSANLQARQRSSVTATAPASAASAPAARPSGGQTVAAAGGAGGRVTVGRQYAATQGGVQGNVTYNAQGQRTFTSNRPAPGTAAPAAPAAGAAGAPGGPRVSPAAAPATAAPARPSIPSQVADLQRMRAASLMRQQGRTMPNGSIPTSSSLAPRPAAAPAPAGALATTTATALRPTAYNPTPAPAAAPRPAAAPVRRPAPTRAPILQRQSFDPFDIIMGYLLDEGYAEDEKSAAVIMANMSEEWKQSIMEGPDGMMRSAASRGRGQIVKTQREPGPRPSQSGSAMGPKPVDRSRLQPPAGATVYRYDSAGKQYTHIQR